MREWFYLIRIFFNVFYLGMVACACNPVGTIREAGLEDWKFETSLGNITSLLCAW
jgi:hypothetical protein